MTLSLLAALTIAAQPMQGPSEYTLATNGFTLVFPANPGKDSPIVTIGIKADPKEILFPSGRNQGKVARIDYGVLFTATVTKDELATLKKAIVAFRAAVAQTEKTSGKDPFARSLMIDGKPSSWSIRYDGHRYLFAPANATLYTGLPESYLPTLNDLLSRLDALRIQAKKATPF